MPKAVQAEEAIEAHFDGLLRARVQAEVGLLVGKAGVGSRDLALAVVPTPSQQDGEPVLTVTAGGAAAAGAKPRKGGAGGGKAAAGGGVAVAVAGELGLRERGAGARGGARGRRGRRGRGRRAGGGAAAAAATGAPAPPAGGPGELLLLHVDSGSRKFSMRSCSVASAAAAAASLKPCELKFGPCLSSLVALRCSHAFELALPSGADGAARAQALLQASAAVEGARVLSAVATLAGAAPPAGGGALVVDALPPGSGCGLRDAARVELLCLPPAAAALQGGAGAGAVSSGGCLGAARLRGSVEALAYVHKRDPLAKALLEVKQDVVGSLSARLQLLADEALAAADDAAEAGGGAAAAAPPAPAHPLLVPAGAGARVRQGLARRVLLPWAGLGLQVCDYLTAGLAAAVAMGFGLMGLGE
ncbi:hypothetical protein HT031_006034 [Scenedesmus sp. PABB004]|nr:hypothetical protein HT031_006034 [Scenedesmus sp. PABB004]